MSICSVVSKWMGFRCVYSYFFVTFYMPFGFLTIQGSGVPKGEGVGGSNTLPNSEGLAYRGGIWGFKHPPKFRSFDEVEPDYKLSGKCLVFLFQHPN